MSFEDVTRYFGTPTDPPTILSGEPTPAPSTVGISASFDPSRCHYWKGVKGPSISWWLIFLGVRQVITLGLARAVQYVVIHYALKINFSGLMGPTVRLFLLQAKGWPFVTVGSLLCFDFLNSVIECRSLYYLGPSDLMGSIEFCSAVWITTLLLALVVLPRMGGTL